LLSDERKLKDNEKYQENLRCKHSKPVWKGKGI